MAASRAARLAILSCSTRGPRGVINEHPEEILGYSDGMEIPMQGEPVTLERFKELYSAALAES